MALVLRGPVHAPVVVEKQPIDKVAAGSLDVQSVVVDKKIKQSNACMCYMSKHSLAPRPHTKHGDIGCAGVPNVLPHGHSPYVAGGRGAVAVAFGVFRRLRLVVIQRGAQWRLVVAVTDGYMVGTVYSRPKLQKPWKFRK